MHLPAFDLPVLCLPSVLLQAAMLISGLWGICYYREIINPVTIIKWFLSASLTVAGILFLSYEHQT